MADAQRPIPPAVQRLVLLGFFGIYGGFLALPRVQATPGLFWAIAGTWLGFAVWLGALALGARRRGQTLGMQFMPRKPHLVQIVMHSSVFAYWGWYWENVYAQVPLIIAQVFFAYLVDVGLSWKRYGNFRMSFGHWNIVGSTNLFLWFKDDWFALQLGMIALAYLAREYVKWEREGKSVHIFNPSAIGLTVAALGLIVTQQVHHTWGPEISVTLGYGPFAFEQMFLAGVVVQLFFAVGLVTASAAVSAVLLGLLWYAITGTWLFVDTAIPIAVFLGMTLLVTDPVSSPYTDGGKIAFGVLYSVGVMGLYILLRGMERPALGEDPGLTVAFFDKVLQVPLMNLMVRWIDRVFGGIPVRAWTERLVRLVRPADRPRPTGPAAIYAGGGLSHRVAHVVLWTGAFVAIRPQLIEHPGADPAFWQTRCDNGADATACENWRRVLVGACDAGTG
ncbi:MAG: hypothetical protein KC613_25780, partial [Myxococcales bacterium]|nr:hypothetical protein [Myxococcales bacterium]